MVSLTGAAYGHGTTSTSGQVMILVNPAYGTITATASKSGFMSGTFTLDTIIGEGQQLQMEANPANVSANMPTNITFTVTAGNTPVSNAIVFLTEAASGIGTTDSTGRVVIPVNAAYGTISATASKSGYSSGTMTLSVDEGAVNVTPTPIPGVTIPAGNVTPTPQILTGTPSTGVVTRTMPASISADTILTVELTPSPASGFDAPGYQVIETLPQGFTYINTTAIGVNVRDNVLTFTQMGSSGISYNVMSPSSNGSSAFSGTFRDELNNVGIVQGTSAISVGASTGGPLRYDTNGDGRIARNEAIQAVIDYFSSSISRQDAIEVVIRYFSG